MDKSIGGIFNTETGLDKANGKRELAGRIFEQFIEGLENYRAAIANAQAIYDLDQIGFLAHRLQGAATYCGAEAIVDATSALDATIEKNRPEDIDGDIALLFDEMDLAEEIAKRGNPYLSS